MCYLFIFKITVVWHLYFLFNPRNCTLHIISLRGVYVLAENQTYGQAFQLAPAGYHSHCIKNRK